MPAIISQPPKYCLSPCKNLNPTSIHAARNQGKPQAIAMIRETCPYSNVIMIGDGITDLEAVQVRIEQIRNEGVDS